MTNYTPQTFTLRPRSVEAIRYTAENCASVHFFVGSPHVRASDHSNDLCETGIFVPTGEGVKIAALGDWVVQSEYGHLDVLTHDQFGELYEPKRRSAFGKRWIVSALAMTEGGRIIDRVIMSKHWTAGSARRTIQKYRSFDNPNNGVGIVYQINHVDEVLP